MERPKQQALAFLLGAVLVGGVVGFSAERMFRRDDTSLSARRTAMYDDLGLRPAQRPVMDSLLDDQNCKFDVILRTVRPALDSQRVATRASIDATLTAEQRVRLEARRRDDDTRKETERRQMRAACRK